MKFAMELHTEQHDDRSNNNDRKMTQENDQNKTATEKNDL